MPLRMMEINLPAADAERAQEIVDAEVRSDPWLDELPGDRALLKVLTTSWESGLLLDRMESAFAGTPGFRIVLYPVEAAVPGPGRTSPAAGRPRRRFLSSIAREELYADIVEAVEANRTFFSLIALSTVVAAIGLLRDNIAVIIGAMVLAPLMAPNVGLSLAFTLGDSELGRRSAKTLAAGVGLSLMLSSSIGLFWGGSPDSTMEIQSRTGVAYTDLILALVSGCAGVLAFTTGASSALIGVMVAVALLPPLVASGLLLGSGYYAAASGALLLLMINIVCINLSGVLTFVAQGIRPRTWWEATEAKKAWRKALILWFTLFILLLFLIALSEGGP